MKKIILSPLLISAPMIVVSCSTKNDENKNQWTITKKNDNLASSNVEIGLKTDNKDTLNVQNIEKYGYLDILKIQPRDNKILILENDLLASKVFPSFLVYDNFEQTEDIENEFPDEISNFKISNIFNQDFFKNKFIVYVAINQTSINPINYRDKDYLISQSLIPFAYNAQGQVINELSVLTSVSDYAPAVQLPGEYSSYFRNSLMTLFVAFDKKYYDEVIKIIEKITDEDQKRSERLKEQNQPQTNTPSPQSNQNN
ncbi:hypothetical protein EG856_00565 [Mycoplasmopsis phocirhinis]|uniref:Lipoprotein n=1 Tax=Mycoplasmopsis phocirhinis TaxID=142650 RepID=A0A4P6MP09_9BACT|nr:hypothetical protein [Mycoplasmopsis phocirhinis]QBF34426.1 hypothetical protein EG856_00565 [Mycoplasmopsis phocirhinis]